MHGRCVRLLDFSSYRRACCARRRSSSSALTPALSRAAGEGDGCGVGTDGVSSYRRAYCARREREWLQTCPYPDPSGFICIKGATKASPLAPLCGERVGVRGSLTSAAVQLSNGTSDSAMPQRIAFSNASATRLFSIVVMQGGMPVQRADGCQYVHPAHSPERDIA